MAINLELPRKLQAVMVKTHQGAAELMRPIARKYDLKEHAYPVELDTLLNLFEGASESIEFAGADALRGEDATGRGTGARTTTAPTWPRCCRPWRPAGATSR